MESKVKHRILGILVIIGLVIILLPLFQNSNESTKEARLIKAPPFPDQAVQVSTDESTPQNNAPVTSENSKSNEKFSEQQPDDTISVLRPSVINNVQAPAITKPNNVEVNIAETPSIASAEEEKEKANETRASLTTIEPEQAEETREVEPVHMPEDEAAPTKTAEEPAKAIQNESVQAEEMPAETKKVKFEKSAKIAENKKPAKFKPVVKALTNNGLVELKDAAWVIQLGSFKNKANALRLVNQLRANGYSAFIQQISTSLGENIRVFVGPENKQKSAHALAQKLETDMHLRGIVISYQPLAL